MSQAQVKSSVEGVEIVGAMKPGYERVLTDEALARRKLEDELAIEALRAKAEQARAVAAERAKAETMSAPYKICAHARKSRDDVSGGWAPTHSNTSKIHIADIVLVSLQGPPLQYTSDQPGGM